MASFFFCHFLIPGVISFFQELLKRTEDHTGADQKKYACRYDDQTEDDPVNRKHSVFIEDAQYKHGNRAEDTEPYADHQRDAVRGFISFLSLFHYACHTVGEFDRFFFPDIQSVLFFCRTR